MTQTEFGRLFGLTPQKICEIENKKQKGRPEFWLSLQIQFNLRPEEILKLMEAE
jgi:DNA-binding XRE family transcriptional regulator